MVVSSQELLDLLNKWMNESIFLDSLHLVAGVASSKSGWLIAGLQENVLTLVDPAAPERNFLFVRLDLVAGSLYGSPRDLENLEGRVYLSERVASVLVVALPASALFLYETIFQEETPDEKVED